MSLTPQSQDRGDAPSRSAEAYAWSAIQSGAPWCLHDGCLHLAEAPHGVGSGKPFCPIHSDDVVEAP